IVIPPAIFFYYSTLSDSRFKTLQQNRQNQKTVLFRFLNTYKRREQKNEKAVYFATGHCSGSHSSYASIASISKCYD
ncbi:hypothetical protein, partial [Enterococcus faecium]|uniref:hypothetical protein n=1 Tax=Enterococcus faecium TaxID=1352 RepID=UPI001E6451C3